MTAQELAEALRTVAVAASQRVTTFALNTARGDAREALVVLIGALVTVATSDPEPAEMLAIAAEAIAEGQRTLDRFVARRDATAAPGGMPS